MEQTNNPVKFSIYKDGKKKRGLVCFEELKDIISKISPEKEENIEEVFIVEHKPCTHTFPISSLIEALENIKERYGDIPVWEYNTHYDCPKPYVPGFSNIRVVNKYDWSQYNTRHREVHIENQPALIILK